VYSRNRVFCIGIGILCVIVFGLLVGAYRKGWNDAVVENRLAESETVIEMVGEKEKISMEIAKKTVPEKRKGLARYVIKGD